YYQRNYRPTDIDIIQEICNKDPEHDFANDKRIFPTLALTRQTTRDSRKSVPVPAPAPPYVNIDTQSTSRPSLTTEHATQFSIPSPVTETPTTTLPSPILPSPILSSPILPPPTYQPSEEICSSPVGMGFAGIAADQIE